MHQLLLGSSRNFLFSLVLIVRVHRLKCEPRLNLEFCSVKYIKLD